MRIVLRLLTTAAALAVAAWLFDGIAFPGGPADGWDARQHDLLPLLLIAAILGIITSFVKPVLTILSIPLIILTLGLFLFVINAAMLLLTSKIAEWFEIPFHVEGFWTAVGGSIVITIVTWIIDGFVGEEA